MNLRSFFFYYSTLKILTIEKIGLDQIQFQRLRILLTIGHSRPRHTDMAAKHNIALGKPYSPETPIVRIPAHSGVTPLQPGRSERLVLRTKILNTSIHVFAATKVHHLIKRCCESG